MATFQINYTLNEDYDFILKNGITIVLIRNSKIQNTSINALWFMIFRIQLDNLFCLL